MVFLITHQAKPRQREPKRHIAKHTQAFLHIAALGGTESQCATPKLSEWRLVRPGTQTLWMLAACFFCFVARTRMAREVAGRRAPLVRAKQRLRQESASPHRSTAGAREKTYNTCDSPAMSSLLFLHHFYLTLIIKSYILCCRSREDHELRINS